MRRSFEPEILDVQELAPDELQRIHAALSLTHKLLGNHRAVLRALKTDHPNLKRVLDIGCGHGGLLAKVRRELGVETVGADLRPPRDGHRDFSILKLDATRDDLPAADVAVSVCLMHHLQDDEFIRLVRNVARSCRRFIILDLVRHPLPLALFRTFAPLALPRVNVLDGAQSIRRAYTPAEFRSVIARALEHTGGTVQHSLNPFRTRQLADIRYRPV